MLFSGSLAFPSRLSAQSNDEPFFIATHKPSDLRPYWSSDSRLFVFSDGFSRGTQAPYEAWYQYDVETQEVVGVNRWPLQVELTHEQLIAFEVGWQGDVVSSILASPNGRYIVYGSYHPTDWSIPDNYRAVGLADLETGQYRIFDIPMSPFSVFDCSTYTFYSCVKWGDDSSSFMLSFLDSFGVISTYYFGGVEAGLLEVEYTDISGSSFVVKPDKSVEIDFQPEAGESILYTGNFLDNVDVNNVLMEMDGSYSLILWNPSNSAQSRVLEVPDHDIRNGTFFLNDTTRVLYICGRGLVEYDLTTGKDTLLNPSVQSDYTFFSPNGRFLVNTVHDVDKDTWAFYMIDLTQYNN